MSQLPRLKVKTWPYGYLKEEIRDFEQAKEFLNFDSTLLVTVEGQVLVYYDELVRLAAQDDYKDKEFLKVEIVPLMAGG